MNIPGVTILQGSKNGPKVGIIAGTHGNETAGLSVFRKLEHQFAQNPLRKGQLVLIHNNLKATRLKKRFCDLNMNRLPSKAITQTRPKQYEIKRLQQLHPVIKDLDYVLDIHTTSAMPDPFVVILTKTVPSIAKRLGIPTIIGNMAKTQQNKAFISFCGGAKTVRVGIECGIHGTPESRETALSATINFLQEIDFIKDKSASTWRKPTIFQLSGSVMAPARGYTLTRTLKPFEPLKKGETILLKKGFSPIKIAENCQVLLPPKNTTVQYPNEEIFFTIQQQ